MIDIQGIYGALIELFGTAPNATRAQFITAVEDRGIATPTETNRFLDKFLEIGAGMGLIASADFDVLTAKVREVGLDRATNGSRVIYDKLIAFVGFKIDELQDQLDAMRAALAETEDDLSRVDSIRTWINNNAPGSSETKTTALRTFDLGKDTLLSRQSIFTVKIVEWEDKIRELGGEPI